MEYLKRKCIPKHSSPSIHKTYKINVISIDLHRLILISSKFDTEIEIIKFKFKLLGYPLPFTENVIRAFKEKKHK